MSHEHVDLHMLGGVFPARAGMSRPRAVTAGGDYRFPRASGDEPLRLRMTLNSSEFSPRERG